MTDTTATQNLTRRPLGTGTLRERRPGVFELRIAIGTDPTSHRTRQVSHSVQGTREQAEALLARLAATGCAGRPTGPVITVGELLGQWLEADHPWKPSTLVGYRSNARFLSSDTLADRRAEQLLPADVRAAVRRWRDAGASDAVVAGRFRTLRAALGWAYTERILDQHPLRAMRGPGRAIPRRPLGDADVRALIGTAEHALLEALANDRGTRRDQLLVHRRELHLLLVRLAADSGARRGELAALRIGDLDGRVLHIDRADSAGQLTSPKSGHGRTLTLGSSTAALWHGLAAGWERRLAGELGPWLFSHRLDHEDRLGATTLGHRFAELRTAAQVPDASLHRLRHNVASFLVARGQILQAQARLGHADAATTLREYAYALPLTDEPVADALDRHLNCLAENLSTAETER
jgi:integrase